MEELSLNSFIPCLVHCRPRRTSLSTVRRHRTRPCPYVTHTGVVLTVSSLPYPHTTPTPVGPSTLGLVSPGTSETRGPHGRVCRQRCRVRGPKSHESSELITFADLLKS